MNIAIESLVIKSLSHWSFEEQWLVEVDFNDPITQ